MSEVAERHGVKMDLLCRINGIKDPDRIKEGETIALHPRVVMKVTFQFLDGDRNPLTNARVRLEYGDKRKVFSSGSSGRIPAVITQTLGEVVRVFMARADGTWKKITEVSSGWGNQLVTLVSPKIRIHCRTMPHPKDAAGRPEPDKGAIRKQVSIGFEN